MIILKEQLNNAISFQPKNNATSIIEFNILYLQLNSTVVRLSPQVTRNGF